MKPHIPTRFLAITVLSTAFVAGSTRAQHPLAHSAKAIPGCSAGVDWLLQKDEPLSLPMPAGATAPGLSTAQRPLVFERNEGQTAEEVAFLSRGRGYTLFITGNEAVMKLVEPSGEDQAEAERTPRGVARKDAGSWNSSLQEGAEVGRRGDPSVLRMRLADSSLDGPVSGEEPQQAKAHYFIGNDPSRWRTNIATYARVKCDEVYPGIDLVYYGNEGRLEYDFVVAPGADPNQIALQFDGAERMKVDADGDLVLSVGGREVRWQRPLVYQQVGERRVEIAGRYRIRRGTDADGAEGPPAVAGMAGERRVQFVSFDLAAYDLALPLVIDPVLVYSTYLGGTDVDSAKTIAADAEGNAYVGGDTASLQFPLKNALRDQFSGGVRDLFVAKYSPTGELLFSTFLGGSDWEMPGQKGIAVSASGDCWVSGETWSTDFPTAEAVQTAYGGGFADGFLAKLSSDGSRLLASTYLGGSEYDHVSAVAIAASGDLYLAGRTSSPDFPTRNGFQMEMSPINRTDTTPQGDGFLARFTSDGRELVFATYKPRTATTAERPNDLALDTVGNVYTVSWLYGDSSITGWLVSKVSADGRQLLFDKRLGPFPVAVAPSMSSAPVLCLLPNQEVVVAGHTFRRNLPAANTPNPTLSGSDPQPEGYLAKYHGTTGEFITGAYFGGNGSEGPVSMFPGVSGDVMVVGSTWGKDFQSSGYPVTDPFDTNLVVGATADVFVTEFSGADFSVVYSTVVGGMGSEMVYGAARDALGDVLVAGYTQGQLPAVNAAQPGYGGGGFDAFVLKLHLNLRSSRLLITPVSAGVKVSWPAEVTGYVLESAEGFPAGQWSPVGVTPVVEGADQGVTVEAGGSARFFRLRKL